MELDLFRNGSIYYVNCSYMQGGVTLGNALCNLSRNVDRNYKGLHGYVLKFRANTNLLPKTKIARQVADGSVTQQCATLLHNSVSTQQCVYFLQSLQKVELDSFLYFLQRLQDLLRDDFGRSKVGYKLYEKLRSVTPP